ncbi:hypothetical protein VARIO8X_110051 [Burkholderiales bacterium 8X]|nr:hypothetical protein VARIO8X_110051 [Burkholderiales bacterium 8X]
MTHPLKPLVDETFRLNAKHNDVLGLTQDQVMQPPASEEQIARLESHLGVVLPPLYKAFLRICNGWTFFFADMHLLSVEEQISGDFARYVHQWKGEQWAEGEEVPVEAIVFAIAIDTNHALLFDTKTTREDGEMEVVWWDDGELDRNHDLVEFMRARIERLEYLIARRSTP